MVRLDLMFELNIPNNRNVVETFNLLDKLNNTHTHVNTMMNRKDINGKVFYSGTIKYKGNLHFAALVESPCEEQILYYIVFWNHVPSEDKGNEVKEWIMINKDLIFLQGDDGKGSYHILLKGDQEYSLIIENLVIFQNWADCIQRAIEASRSGHSPNKQPTEHNDVDREDIMLRQFDHALKTSKETKKRSSSRWLFRNKSKRSTSSSSGASNLSTSQNFVSCPNLLEEEQHYEYVSQENVGPRSGIIYSPKPRIPPHSPIYDTPDTEKLYVQEEPKQTETRPYAIAAARTHRPVQETDFVDGRRQLIKNKVEDNLLPNDFVSSNQNLLEEQQIYHESSGDVRPRAQVVTRPKVPPRPRSNGITHQNGKQGLTGLYAQNQYYRTSTTPYTSVGTVNQRPTQETNSDVDFEIVKIRTQSEPQRKPTQVEDTTRRSNTMPSTHGSCDELFEIEDGVVDGQYMIEDNVDEDRKPPFSYKTNGTSILTLFSVPIKLPDNCEVASRKGHISVKFDGYEITFKEIIKG